MSAAVERIQKEIQNLPLNDLLDLHTTLLGAIQHQEQSMDFDPEYREEIRRRIDQILSGEAEGVEVFEALKAM